MNNNEAKLYQDEPLPLLLTLEETRHILRLGRQQIYSMAREGRLPGCRRYGRQFRVVRDVLLAELAGQQNNEQAKP